MWNLHQWLQEHSTIDRVRKCLHVRYKKDIGVVVTDTWARFDGLITCGLVWVCPSCVERINRQRREEMHRATTAWEATGGRVLMITLTPRHRKRDLLAWLWDGLVEAWAKTAKGKVWDKWLQRLGSPGYVKVVEVTHGRNGWHPHLHLYFFLGPEVTKREFLDFRKWLFNKWIGTVERVGLDTPMKRGLRAEWPENTYPTITAGGEAPDQSSGSEALAKYPYKSPSQVLSPVKKQTVRPKPRRPEHVQPTESVWVLLERASQGDRKAKSLWREYEEASSGRRQTTWSKGLKVTLGIDQETPKDVPQSEMEHTDDVVGIPTTRVIQLGDTALGSDPRITGSGWDHQVRSSSQLRQSILNAAVAGLLPEVLDSHGIPHQQAKQTSTGLAEQPYQYVEIGTGEILAEMGARASREALKGRGLVGDITLTFRGSDGLLRLLDGIAGGVRVVEYRRAA